MIGFKNSYFLLIHLPSCYQTVQYANHINSCILNQQMECLEMVSSFRSRRQSFSLLSYFPPI